MKEQLMYIPTLYTAYGQERHPYFVSHKFVDGLEMECARFFFRDPTSKE